MASRHHAKNAASAAASAGSQPPDFQPRAERLAAGRALRETLPRERHGLWKKPANKRDPIDVLEESDLGRLPDLIPIRYGRMLASPFTFLRGSAGLMAYDLAAIPSTGLRVQACGDCHLMNFGMFATPERNLVFDINDFDETLPAPWEWDVKRLAASVVVAARDNGHADKKARYLGKSDAFEQAVGEFALAYADQTARDHAALVAAVKTGRVKAQVVGNR